MDKPTVPKAETHSKIAVSSPTVCPAALSETRRIVVATNTMIAPLTSAVIALSTAL